MYVAGTRQRFFATPFLSGAKMALLAIGWPFALKRTNTRRTLPTDLFGPTTAFMETNRPALTLEEAASCMVMVAEAPVPRPDASAIGATPRSMPAPTAAAAGLPDAGNAGTGVAFAAAR